MNNLFWASDLEIPIPDNEEERIKKLMEYEQYADEHTVEIFDRLARLAAEICDTPKSQINIHYAENQIVKAAFGLDKDVSPRSATFCQFTIMDDKILEIQDAKTHEIFHTNPFVTGDFNLQYYAGVPLRTSEGLNIGALCIIDHKPNKINEIQKKALYTLAQEVINQYELNLTRKKLEQLNQEKDEMIRLVSHDLRNPLSGILGASELLSVEIEDETLLPLVEIINASGYKLLDIINTLLSSDYIINHGFSLQRRMANVVELIEEVLELHKASALVKKIELSFNHSESVFNFKLDADKFKQIVGNLVSNAIKFSFPNSLISINLKRGHQKELIFMIHDEGIGMPDEIKNHLFDGSADILRTGTDDEPTSGIGMPYIKQFVELHKGEIIVDSVEGKGTTFTVIFPT
ncbi:sensor histidine kinase [bacterium]|nr:MAG: sensor histidine kinase [bacterium]